MTPGGEQPPALALEDIRFRWPRSAVDVLAIDSLRVRQGERVFVQGGSGSGKSTLLSLAAGVLVPRSGHVRLLGRDWQAWSGGKRDRARADHIGYIFQQFNLLPYLGVLDNVLLPCLFSSLRAARATQTNGNARAEAQALLSALQLDRSLWDRPAGALSVGQQQRVAAARALIGRPELVIADEPTSALDDDRRDAFMALLLKVCDAAGSALLFVSHDTRLATHFQRTIHLPDLDHSSILAASSP